MDKLSLTGHDRAYYKALKEKKEAELGIKILGSIGFVKQELFNTAEWVHVFNEKEKYSSIDEIVSTYERDYGRVGIKIVQHENDGEEFRIWIANES